MGTNLSKQHREEISACIDILRKQIEQDRNNTEAVDALNKLENELTRKKYGLVWEEHEEEIDRILKENLPVLTEQQELALNNDGQLNFLIEGDNLASLELLKRTHSGRIDLIYIDPPYNTGSKDFVYDDTYIDKTDSFSHSKWLSFMVPRLRLMRELLHDETGVLFISIDDNEQAALKLVCDEIFGESCFVTDAVWRSSDNSNNNSLKFSEDYNHTLIYSKRSSWKPNFIDDPNKRKHFKNPDNDPRGPWFDGNPVNNPGWRPNLQFNITAPNGNVIKHPKNGWRWSMDTIKEKMNTGELRFSEDGTRLIRRTYLSEMGGLTPSNLWIDLEATGHTRGAKYDLKKIFPEIKVTDLFSTPKPTLLVDYIMQLATKDDSIILDCFAGSGTTGHAVLSFNKKLQDSKRSFILCTNNENDICREATYERIKRVIERDKCEASIKYFKVDFVPTSIDGEQLFYDEYSDELLLHVKELVELENAIDFDSDKTIDIALYEDDIDALVSDNAKLDNLSRLYVGHDVLLTENQKHVFEQHNIEVDIIPEYYYANEVGA